MVPLRSRPNREPRRWVLDTGHPCRFPAIGRKRSIAVGRDRTQRCLPLRATHHWLGESVMRPRKPFEFSRRRLLQSIGLGAAAGPLLPVLNASAQTNTRIKRLILLWSPDGAAALNYNTTIDWKPQGTEQSFTLQAIQAPLQPFAPKLVIPWGLTMTAGGAGENHAFGMAGVWTGATLHPPSAGANFDGGNGNRTGWGSGPSID